MKLNRLDELREIPLWKRRAAGRHFVEHRTRAEDVSALIEFLTANLFRRHIRNRPEGRMCRTFATREASLDDSDRDIHE